MTIRKTNRFAIGRADAVVLPVFSPAGLSLLERQFPEIAALRRRRPRRWGPGDEMIVGSATHRTTLILLHAGKPDDPAAARSLARRAMQQLVAVQARRAQLHVAEAAPARDWWLNLSDFLHLNAYRFERYRKKRSVVPLKLELSAAGRLPLRREELRERHTLMAHVDEARDLVNEPPAKINPDALTAVFRRAAQRHGLRFSALRGAELRKRGMAGLTAVGAGSAFQPALLTLSWAPPQFRRTVVLVGKGLTFDSGGLNIKTAGAHMEEMKSDMAGAAAVLGAVCAAASLQLPVRVTALAAVAENMPSGSAYKPGDILGFANGKTVEVVNTDAEGRLALADALIVASRLKPDAVIELSTLTGAIVTALGDGYAGLMCTQRRLAGDLLRAGDACGEPLWELPLFKEYRESITSRVADLKNANYGGASSIKAGLFLAEFTAKVPYAHVDIAGTAFLDKANHWHGSEGATGFGVRLLVEYLRGLA